MHQRNQSIHGLTSPHSGTHFAHKQLENPNKNAGQEFDVKRLDRGDYRFVRRVAPRNEGTIDWLLARPHKDFFVPIESESTDTL